MVRGAAQWTRSGIPFAEHGRPGLTGQDTLSQSVESELELRPASLCSPSHTTEGSQTTGETVSGRRWVANLYPRLTRFPCCMAKLRRRSTRTGKRSAAPALAAWAARANAKRSAAELRAVLKNSLKEETAGKGRRFGSGREAIRWLES